MIDDELPPSDDQGDLFKQAGIERVTENNETWMFQALELVARIAPGEELIGEELRVIVRGELGNPKHHNAWGALVHHAVRRNLLRPTGRFRNMRDPRSHARITPIYTTTQR